MREFALGFFTVLALAAAVFVAIWKFLEREELRFITGGA